MKDYSKKTNISIRHLRAALAVAERQSFTAAADELGVAASALTETIKQMERETGVILFDRTTRRVEVTELGLRFVNEARRVLTGFDSCISDMRAFGGLRQGRVSVAAVPSMMAHAVVPATRTFKQKHPTIDVLLRDENAEVIERMVLEGEADLGVAARWGEIEDLLYEPLISDQFGLACGLAYPLASRKSVKLAELRQHQILALESQTGIRIALEKAARLEPGLWSSDIEASSLLTLITLLNQNVGVAIIPELATRLPAIGSLAYIPIKDFHLRRDLFLISRKQRKLTPAARGLSAEIRNVVKND